MRLEWSNVNQAWFVMFGDSVLRIFNTLAEARQFIEECS